MQKKANINKDENVHRFALSAKERNFWREKEREIEKERQRKLEKERERKRQFWDNIHGLTIIHSKD